MIKNTITTILLVCASLFGIAQTNIINTIAGKDSSGYSGDGGLATSAHLNAPVSIFLDKVDNLYIVDGFNHVIRKVDASSHIISTIVGTGTPGFAGDGGPAANAQLFVPSGIFINNHDDIYIADGLNHRIRKVLHGTNVISTVAGNGLNGNTGDMGFAIDAQIGNPNGIYVDTLGNIYFTDCLNHVVRRIEATSGIISTIAGKGFSGYTGDGGLATNATLNVPCGIRIDENGDVIILDTYNNAIRKIDDNTGIISTIAGMGIAGFSGDNGLAINAQINQPSGLNIDNANNIFFADYANGAIRRIDGSTGIIVTVAGTGLPGFSGDGGPALDAQLFCSDVAFDSRGDMYIADYENDRIRRVSSSVAVTSVSTLPFTMYPNPTTGILHIQAPISKANLSVTNIIGVEVYRVTLDGITNVDLTNLTNGVYFVHVDTGANQYTEKITVLH